MKLLRSLGRTLQQGFRTLMPTCRQATRLQSDALDRPLSLPKRIGLAVHLLLCRWCRRYGRQIRFLRESAHEHHEEVTEASPRQLSPEARERLKRALQDQSK